MAPKYISICFFLLLISIVALPLVIHAKPSAFQFIKDLEGCQKGKSVKDLNKLKAYLQRFGYLNYQNPTATANEDEFDDSLEEAIKTYQLNHRLKPTGILDSETVSKMIVPRCGVPDIKNGTNYMHGHEHWHSGIHTVAHYNFFPDYPRWPESKTQLTYYFYPDTPSEAQAAVGRAFGEWASAVNYFTFSETDDLQSSDLKVGFFSGDHGDGYSFDGPSGILAHGFPPSDEYPYRGNFHYDADENWVVGAVPDGIDLETVAIHEIGHLLGLAHSSDPDAIMYPYTPPDSTKGLNEDDIEGLKALYGLQ